MTRKEYEKRRDRLIAQYFANRIGDTAYVKRRDALDREFAQSQQEKPNDSQSVGTAGTEAGG